MDCGGLFTTALSVFGNWSTGQSGGGQVKPSGSHEAEIDSSDRVVFRGPRTLLPKAIPTYTEWVPHSWVLSPQQRAISEVSPQQRTHPPQQRAFGKQKRA